jgi:hypothetical protein
VTYVIALAIFAVLAALHVVAARAYRAGSWRTLELLLEWERGKRELPTPSPAVALATSATPDRKALHGRTRTTRKKR